MERQFKDSGNEWIGRIPESWKSTKLFNLCTIKGRIGWNGLRSDEFKENSYAYLVTGQDFNSSEIDWSRCYQIDKERYDEDPFIQLKNGDILITKDGTIGKIAKVSNMDKPACLNSGIFVLKQRKITFVQNYLYWYLVSPLLIDYNSYINSGGTTIMHLYQNVFERFPLLIPPFNEQQRIANYLDEKCGEIDALIGLQGQMIEELKTYKQSIITEAVTKGLNHNAKLVPSGIDWIGEIPEGWKVFALKWLMELYAGATPKSDNEKFWDGDIPWITPADYKTEDIFVSGGRRNISQKGLESCATTILPKGSIIFSKRAPIGLVAINSEPLCTNQGCIGCIVNQSRALNKYYYYTLSIFKEQFELYGSGTTFKEISATKFADFIVPVPPLLEQQEIVRYLDDKCSEIDKLIDVKQQKIEKLKDYKKGVIYEAVTGKINIE